MAISAELGDKLEAVVDDLVKNGRYNSKSEVLREGVRLVQEREAALKRLDAALDEGIDDMLAGRGRPADEVFDELRAKYQAMIDAERLMRVVISTSSTQTDLVDIGASTFLGLDSPFEGMPTARREQHANWPFCASLSDAPLRFVAVRKRCGIEVRRAVQGLVL